MFSGLCLLFREVLFQYSSLYVLPVAGSVLSSPKMLAEV